MVRIYAHFAHYSVNVSALIFESLHFIYVTNLAAEIIRSHIFFYFSPVFIKCMYIYIHLVQCSSGMDANAL